MGRDYLLQVKTAFDRTLYNEKTNELFKLKYISKKRRTQD
jgi:hypothetical protein